MLIATQPDCPVQRHLGQFIEAVGYETPELPLIEEFHETTRLGSHHERAIGRRIGAYLVEPRAIAETASNRKRYDEHAYTPLPGEATLSMSLGSILSRRTSCRVFNGEAICISTLGSILTAVRTNRVATSGIDGSTSFRFRPYPSGGGLYPCEIYFAAINVTGLEPGLYHYDAWDHAVAAIGPRPAGSVMRTCLGDPDGLAGNAAVIFFTSAIFERSAVKYGARGYRFCLMEAGMIPQMLNLAAVSNNLSALHWGGCLDGKVEDLFRLDGLKEAMISCLIVGHPA